MKDGKTKHEALKTALAFHYQVLIGLEKCFSMQKGQSVWFERDGDVSLVDVDPQLAAQAEAKAYSKPLTDHHANLWNTLNNWLDPNFKHEQYGALILHTTQAFGSTTRLKDWNAQTAKKRLQTLNDIYDERTTEELDAEKPKEIVRLQKAVMQADRNLRHDIVSKVTLFTEADDADSLRKGLPSKLVGIPVNNQDRYVQGLVGYIYDQADKCSWEVEQARFSATCEELTALYCRKEFTLPPFTGHEASELEVTQHHDNLFVQKINDIEHCDVIPDAIGNWLELQNSLIEELDEYPLYRERTKAYQKQLIKRFELNYSTAQLESDEPIKDSKILYNRTIAEQPLTLGNNTPPIEYKNGLIHDAMDDEERKLKWKVEES